MHTLEVYKKTGFFVDDPSVPIIINDERGIPFYLISGIQCFNLPAGSYQIMSGVFHKMEYPVKFARKKMPPSEVLFPPDTSNYQILFAPNPNKCTIMYPDKCIIFDTSFATAPYPDLFFIRYHEQGHNFYGYEKLYDMKTAEKYCDWYAMNKMLERGFNPSQIDKAQDETLSSRQQYRKDFVQETLTEIAGK